MLLIKVYTLTIFVSVILGIPIKIQKIPLRPYKSVSLSNFPHIRAINKVYFQGGQKKTFEKQPRLARELELPIFESNTQQQFLNNKFNHQSPSLEDSQPFLKFNQHFNLPSEDFDNIKPQHFILPNEQLFLQNEHQLQLPQTQSHHFFVVNKDDVTESDVEAAFDIANTLFTGSDEVELEDGLSVPHFNSDESVNNIGNNNHFATTDTIIDHAIENFSGLSRGSSGDFHSRIESLNKLDNFKVRNNNFKNQKQSSNGFGAFESFDKGSKKKFIISGNERIDDNINDKFNIDSFKINDVSGNTNELLNTAFFDGSIDVINDSQESLDSESQDFSIEDDQESSHGDDIFRIFELANEDDENVHYFILEGPASYRFSYAVNEPSYDLDFGHREHRTPDITDGEYYVKLPDGRKQIISYYVNGHSGFVADLRYEKNALSVPQLLPSPNEGNSIAVPQSLSSSSEENQLSVPQLLSTPLFDSPYKIFE